VQSAHLSCRQWRLIRADLRVCSRQSQQKVSLQVVNKTNPGVMKNKRERRPASNKPARQQFGPRNLRKLELAPKRICIGNNSLAALAAKASVAAGVLLLNMGARGLGLDVGFGLFAS
jgi:hypothetical protein